MHESPFGTQEHRRHLDKVMREYEAEKLAIGVKTARLRALRLAREADTSERTKTREADTSERTKRRRHG